MVIRTISSWLSEGGGEARRGRSVVSSVGGPVATLLEGEHVRVLMEEGGLPLPLIGWNLKAEGGGGMVNTGASALRLVMLVVLSE